MMAVLNCFPCGFHIGQSVDRCCICVLENTHLFFASGIYWSRSFLPLSPGTLGTVSQTVQLWVFNVQVDYSGLGLTGTLFCQVLIKNLESHGYGNIIVEK